ncbi:hypothetical protein V494_01890 [Pseudogymnoascus sp. VKM F-4513 (FW-928)]|nr:hypothetical protein V494_01890 [Pseudogymnoascus sp. VKM F-4513 (FW-928)]
MSVVRSQKPSWPRHGGKSSNALPVEEALKFHQTTRHFDYSATIVLVGSRGSGKRSLAFIGATHLGRRLVTEDQYFQQVTGLSRKDYLSKYGSKEFGRQNVEVLQRMLEDNETGSIIECGMSSLARESQITLRHYAETHPVIHILRNPARIRLLLNLKDSEAARLEQADKSHQSCSNFEYYNLQDSNCESHVEEISQDRRIPNYSFALKDAKQDFSRFLDRITGLGAKQSAYESPFSVDALPPENRPYTYAIPLSLSDLANGAIDLPQLDSGGDAIELQVDMLTPNIMTILSKEVAQIRRTLGIPIIFHVDEVLSNDVSAVISLLYHAIRLGVEYLVIPLWLEDTVIREIVHVRGETKIIGQFIDKEAISWQDQMWISKFERAKQFDFHIVRLLRMALAIEDNTDVRAFSDRVATISSHQPKLIAYNLGPLGKASVVANTIFSPVTHPAIRQKDSRPENFLITAQEAMETLYETGVLDGLKFITFGVHVNYSLSPMMHETAYACLGMKGQYIRYTGYSLDELAALSQDPQFGGAGISQPFKVEIMSRCIAHSRHAKAIGASNTITALRALPDGSADFLLNQANRRGHAGSVCAWFADNTDFLGILACLRRNATPRNVVQPSKTTGLVIGAGGMARASIYAMILLGCRNIFIYNRTLKNAETVADHFNSWAGALSANGRVVTVLRSRNEPWPAEYQQPTFLVSCVPAHEVEIRSPADFEVPEQWLGSPSGGVALELAYKPLNTPLVQQIRRFRQKTGRAWVMVDGLEFIPAQGFAQFELMTGRRAPRAQMRAAAENNYEKVTGSTTDSMV